MSFPEKAFQTRGVCATLLQPAEWAMCLTEGLGRGLTPWGIPKVLCLCDLSLLENPNIQMCLLQKQGQTWALSSHAGLTAHPSPPSEVFSILTFVGFTEQIKGRESSFPGDWQVSFLSSALCLLHKELWGREQSAKRLGQLLGFQSWTPSSEVTTQLQGPTQSAQPSEASNPKCFWSRNYLLVEVLFPGPAPKARPVVHALEIPAPAFSPPHLNCATEACPALRLV